MQPLAVCLAGWLVAWSVGCLLRLPTTYPKAISFDQERFRRSSGSGSFALIFSPRARTAKSFPRSLFILPSNGGGADSVRRSIRSGSEHNAEAACRVDVSCV